MLRWLEELFDVGKDPSCLHNLVSSPEHATELVALRAKLATAMQQADDPMLQAFNNRSDRQIVDQTIQAFYGRRAAAHPSRKAKPTP